jgi:hypothetical protein
LRWENYISRSSDSLIGSKTSLKVAKMMIDFMKENKKVIAFYIIFAVFLNLCVIGICHLIPERLRSGGWFVAPNYQTKSTQK